MDFLFHWSVGFILGSVIVLPFILGRWIYDYDRHSWIQVRWGSVVNKKLARKIKTKTTELASKELYPITSSRFIIYHAIIANLCALLALLPDIGILWGDSGLDHGLWVNIFFFHTTIDNLPGNLVSSYTIYVFITVLILWTLVVSIAINAQIDKDCKENTYI